MIINVICIEILQIKYCHSFYLAQNQKMDFGEKDLLEEIRKDLEDLTSGLTVIEDQLPSILRSVYFSLINL